MKNNEFFLIKYKQFFNDFIINALFVFLKRKILIIYISQKLSNSAPQLIYLVKKIYKLYEVLPDSLAAIYFIPVFFLLLFFSIIFCLLTMDLFIHLILQYRLKKHFFAWYKIANYLLVRYVDYKSRIVRLTESESSFYMILIWNDMIYVTDFFFCLCKLEGYKIVF